MEWSEGSGRRMDQEGTTKRPEKATANEKLRKYLGGINGNGSRNNNTTHGIRDPEVLLHPKLTLTLIQP